MGKLIDHILDSHVLTLVILVLVGVGAVKSISGDLDYREFIETVTVLIVGGSIGRGIAAYKKG